MQSNYNLMPTRAGKSDGSFNQANRSIKLFTNYYDVSVVQDETNIYQYSFSLPQEIPQDSSLYERAIESITKILKEKIGYVTHSGQMVWGKICMKVPTTLECKFDCAGKKFDLQCVVKLTKQLNLKQLNQQKTKSAYLQILNIDLKNKLKQLKLGQLGKQGKYFKKQLQTNFQLNKAGLGVIKGFKFTLNQLNSGLSLQVDVCSRVIQTSSLLQIFNTKQKQKIIQQYTGATVLSKYGNYKTYKVQQIDFNLKPSSLFYNQKSGCYMSYAEYYRSAYGIIINNQKQPLIKVLKTTKKVIKKGGNQIQNQGQHIYLIPEIVSIVGMTDKQRADHKIMKLLAPSTKATPTDRASQCFDIIQKINNQEGLIKINDPKYLSGYILPPPQLKYKNSVVSPDNKGIIKYRGVVRQNFDFNDWLFVYSQSRNHQRDTRQSDQAVDLIMKASQTYGIKFREPAFIAIRKPSVNQWKKQIIQQIQRNGAPQIVVLFMNQHQQQHYGQLKKYLINVLNIPCQFIKRKTLINSKGPLSAASKIAIQMNVKVGLAPWKVQKRHQYFQQKNIMYGALSISKGPKGETLAFVGTIDSDCTKFFSDCKFGIKSQQSLPINELTEIFKNWVKNYYQTNNNKFPDLIILYRQGLSDSQAKDQLSRIDIPALEEMKKQIQLRTNSVPQITILTVNKKINSRYFVQGRNNQPNNGKFDLHNVDSGSVILDQLSLNKNYDFHLSSQYVTQGTCTPTMFKIVYDTSKMPQQALISFTYEQCFNYYNWEGAVRVPACLQYADKLSKLVNMHIKQNIKPSPLTKSAFYL